MTAVELKFEIEKVDSKGDRTMEILATGTAPEEMIRTESNARQQPGFTVMGNVPPAMQGMIEDMTKMFQYQRKPMIKFRLTKEEYDRGSWKVGDTLRIKVMEERN